MTSGIPQHWAAYLRENVHVCVRVLEDKHTEQTSQLDSPTWLSWPGGPTGAGEQPTLKDSGDKDAREEPAVSHPVGTSASPSPGPSAAGLLPLSGEEWLRLRRLRPGLRDPTQGTSRGLVVAEMRFCLCFCRSRPSATGTDVWRPRGCSLKSGLRGQLMGNSQVRHIQTVFPTH